MTDPERISKRSSGLAAQLLQAGVEEQPAQASVQQTLAALGVSAAVVGSSGTAGAVAGSAKGVLGAGAGTGSAALGGSAATGTVKAVSAALFVKWIGIGVVGGVGLAGAAAVASGPAVQPATSQSHTVVAAPTHVPQPVTPLAAVARELPREPPSESASVEAPVVAVTPVPSAPLPHVNANEPASGPATLDVGAPLAAEVAYVDRARALLASGQVEPGLALLRSYERGFPEARLLPEVLFLQLETCDRLGRSSEARAAAQRLLDGFPKSPHASRARKLLFP